MAPYERFFYYGTACACILYWGLYALLTGVRLETIISMLEVIASILVVAAVVLHIYATYLWVSDRMQDRKTKKDPS